MSHQVHIVAKADLKQHHVADVPPPSDLEPEHARVRTVLHSFTANNLTYARMGGPLRWWDAYPVSPYLPQPYNDSASYGIVPVWGYGEVIESKIQDLNPGTIVWGFWPSSNLPVDLKLVPGDIEGNWIETSDHRNSLMPLYNRYMITDSRLRHTDFQGQRLVDLGMECLCGPIFQCGFLLNRFTFGPLAIHPLGLDGQWDAKKADISETLIVNLSTSGKTARGFTDALIHDRRLGTGPLAMLAITSNRESKIVPDTSFATKTITYSDISEADTMDWITQQQVKRVIICDFGGRGDSRNTLISALQEHDPSVKVLAIQIGAEPNPVAIHGMPPMPSADSMILMNTSSMKDKVVATIGGEDYLEQYTTAYRAFFKRSGEMGVGLQWGHGVRGNEGIEGGWNMLCGTKGAVPSDVGLVYKLT